LLLLAGALGGLCIAVFKWLLVVFFSCNADLYFFLLSPLAAALFLVGRGEFFDCNNFPF